jgi:acetyl esterase/lipase
MKQPIFAILFLILMSSCGVLQTQRNKNIPYLSATAELPEKTLNVFAPKKAKNAPVLIFIHGGSWHSGRKEIYDFMGNRLAAKGVVSVIIDYPLAPTYQLPAMEKASARAIQWVKENIASYGGDPANMYVSGHSAGGHLAAATALITDYNESTDNPNISCIPNALVLFNPVFDNGPGGYGYERIGDAYKNFSPLHNIKIGAPPTIVFLGEKDDLVAAAKVGLEAYKANREGV